MGRRRRVESIYDAERGQFAPPDGVNLRESSSSPILFKNISTKAGRQVSMQALPELVSSRSLWCSFWVLDLQTCRRVDPVAFKQAVREWALPPCLHVPIAARDEAAIREHIGDVVKTISHGKALLVQVDQPHRPDPRLPIFEHPNVSRLFEPLQLWVHPLYTRYRSVWRQTFGVAQIDDRVLHHVYNRRKAMLIGYHYVRLAPISRATNSSSAVTEKWGVDLCTKNYVERYNSRGFRILYGDLGHLMTILDIPLGGGVQETFRVGQNLVEVPGLRAPQE